MTNFIIWIVFGALAGWIASILTGKNRKMGAVANIVVGIFGAFVGAVMFDLQEAANVVGLATEPTESSEIFL